jgi:hypothetical protein
VYPASGTIVTGDWLAQFSSTTNREATGSDVTENRYWDEEYSGPLFIDEQPKNEGGVKIEGEREQGSSRQKHDGKDKTFSSAGNLNSRTRKKLLA